MNCTSRISIFILAFLSQALVAAGQINASARDYEFAIDTREILEKATLPHSVDGFEVSCDKRKILTWGKSKTIDTSNPQKSKLTLVDVKDRRHSLQSEFTGGIFGARYIEGGKLAIIETNWDILLDLESGSIKKIEENIDLESRFAFEACDNFPGKTYLKYAK